MLIVDREQVKQLITMEEAINLVEQAFVAYSSSEAIIPPRVSIELNQGKDTTLFMPAFLPDQGGLGIKVVSVFPYNSVHNLPVTAASILLCDSKTGLPTVLMDGTFLTALRTGAASGVATKYLARDDASTLALIGTGGMAAAQLEAICCVRTITDVFLYNRTSEKAVEFVKQMRNREKIQQLSFHICTTPKEAVQQADVVVACTASHTPVIQFSWLKKGSHVNGIGSFHPQMQEVDEQLVRRADIKAVDSIQEAVKAGDLWIPLQNGTISTHDLCEIGALIPSPTPIRPAAEAITFFKSVGLAVQDLAVALKVLENARKESMGLEVEIG